METRFRLVITGATTFLFLFSVISAFPAVIHVPADQPTIQTGIDAAALGDTVLVAAGTYYEIIEMKGDVHLLSETGRADCATIDGAEQSGVVRFHSLSGPCLLEGFTITGGIFHGLDFIGSEVVVRNCLITDNRSWGSGGGGVYCRDSSVAFFDCVISYNQSSYGGGIYVRGLSNLEMTNCLVKGNRASRTGGALDINGPGYFLECTFEDNYAGTNGGGIWSWRKQSYDRCRIKNNYAEFQGGGVFIILSDDSFSDSDFMQCVISGNIVGESDGGGIFSEGTPRLDQCKIWGNSAPTGSGGGIFCTGSPTMIKCEVVDNFAGRNGGGLFLASPDSTVVTQCSLVGNSAVGQGGGIYTYSSHLQLTQSIIAFSKDGEGIFCYGDDSHQIVATCDIYGNQGGDQLCGVDTGGNFSEDPLFCDMVAGNLYLDEESPCLIGVDPYYFIIGANGPGDCSVAPVDDYDLTRHPASGALGQNHPNPFNPITAIPFALQKPGHPTLRIFDLAGRHVITLLGGEMFGAGPHETIWNGRDQAGNSVSSGVYFYRLETRDFSETRRMVLIK